VVEEGKKKIVCARGERVHVMGDRTDQWIVRTPEGLIGRTHRSFFNVDEGIGGWFTGVGVGIPPVY
jgi:hypothetical protein